MKRFICIVSLTALLAHTSLGDCAEMSVTPEPAQENQMAHLSALQDIGEKEAGEKNAPLKGSEMNRPTGIMAEIAEENRPDPIGPLPQDSARPRLYDDKEPNKIISAVETPLNYIVRDKSLQNSFQLGLGYRVDSLDWNIAAAEDGGGYQDPSSGQYIPHILSELQWDDVKLLYLSFDTTISLSAFRTNKPYSHERPLPPRPAYIPLLRFWGGFGHAFDGDVQDSDYAGPNKSLEWSRSNSEVDEGTAYDIYGVLGMKISLADRHNQWVTATPYAGYGLSYLDVNITNGMQVISDQDVLDNWLGQTPGDQNYWTLPPTGKIEGLDSSYNSTWSGWVLGARFDYEFYDMERRPFLALYFDGRYHWDDYEGEGDWNLRTDFAKPFEHSGDGQGFDVQAGVDFFEPENQTAMSVSLSYGERTLSNGKDRKFFSDGSSSVIRLNDVNWNYIILSVNLVKRF